MNENATVVSDDTEVFVMLLLHYNPQREKHLNWFSEVSDRSKDGPRYYSVQEPQYRLATVLCNNILVHSWFGCITTSYIHGHWKSTQYNGSETYILHAKIAVLMDDPPNRRWSSSRGVMLQTTGILLGWPDTWSPDNWSPTKTKGSRTFDPRALHPTDTWSPGQMVPGLKIPGQLVPRTLKPTDRWFPE